MKRQETFGGIALQRHFEPAGMSNTFLRNSRVAVEVEFALHTFGLFLDLLPALKDRNNDQTAQRIWARLIIPTSPD